MNNRNGIIFGTLAVLALLGLDATLPAALAADAPNDAASMSQHHQRHGAAGHGAEGALMQVMHELALSDTQKQQIHTLVRTARSQWQSQMDSGLNDLPALGNPGDPNHAAAVQSAKARAAQRIQDWSELEQQIYALLTTEQRARLPQLLAELQTRMTAHHAEWRSHEDSAH